MLTPQPREDAVASRRIDVGRLTLNARQAGTGPLVCFMHGITANASVWDPILEALSPMFRVVAIDQRGHGRSDKPAAGYTAADYAQDVIDLITTCGEPALLVGHSLGARNALTAAAMAPQLVAGVVAIDFTPFIEVEVLDALETRVRGGDRVFDSHEEIVGYLTGRYERLPNAAIRRRAANGYVEIDGALVPLADPTAMVETAVGLREDLAPTLRALASPALLIRGGDSELVSADAFRKTAELRPDLQTQIVPGADHYVPEEAPDAISDAIVRFVLEVGHLPSPATATVINR